MAKIDLFLPLEEHKRDWKDPALASIGEKNGLVVLGFEYGSCMGGKRKDDVIIEKCQINRRERPSESRNS